MNRRHGILAALLVAWGVGTALAFWTFEGRYLRPVLRPAGAALARLSEGPPASVTHLRTDRGTVTLTPPGPITLLNFWNPDCPCSRFAEAHVGRLAAEYVPQGVRFITVVAAGPTAREQRGALARWRARGLLADQPALADADNRVARTLGVWAAPAAVILDARGQVAYVGAYNAARFCADSRTAWAAQALAAVVRHETPARAAAPFFGCQMLSDKG